MRRNALTLPALLVLLLGCGSATAAPTIVSPGEFQCTKNDHIVIDASDGVFTLTGLCGRIEIRGRNNKLTISAAKVIDISGPNNTLLIDAVDRLTATSSGNSIIYKRGLSGPRASITTIGDNNIITQSGRPGYR